jgi:hypothetical protein
MIEPTPGGPMLKITYNMRRLPHLSREEFQTYYRKNHTRVLQPDQVEQLGMRRYVQLHALSEDQCAKLDNGRGGDDSFDAVAEIWLDDYDFYLKNWWSDKGQEALKALMDDEQNFIDWSRSVMTCYRELVFVDGPSTPAPTPRTPAGK